MFKKMIEKMIIEAIHSKYMFATLNTCNEFTFKEDNGMFIDFELKTSGIDWDSNWKEDVKFVGFVSKSGVEVTMIPYAD